MSKSGLYKLTVNAKDPGDNLVSGADQVEVRVTDSGVGISEEDLPHVFEDFYRGRDGQSGEKGHGLGLALSRRIVELHDGTISVDPKAYPGS